MALSSVPCACSSVAVPRRKACHPCHLMPALSKIGLSVRALSFSKRSGFSESRPDESYSPDVCSRLARRDDERLEKVCNDLDRLYSCRLLQRFRPRAVVELVCRSAASRPGGKLLADIWVEHVV